MTFRIKVVEDQSFNKCLFQHGKHYPSSKNKKIKNPTIFLDLNVF